MSFASLWNFAYHTPPFQPSHARLSHFDTNRNHILFLCCINERLYIYIYILYTYNDTNINVLTRLIYTQIQILCRYTKHIKLNWEAVSDLYKKTGWQRFIEMAY